MGAERDANGRAWRQSGLWGARHDDFLPAPKPLIEVLLEQGRFGAKPALPEFLRSALNVSAPWPALMEGGMLALAPFSVTIR